MMLIKIPNPAKICTTHQEMVLFTHNFAFSTEINREKVLSTLKFPFDDELMKNQTKNL